MEANGLRIARMRALIAALLFGVTQTVDAAEMVARAIGDPPEPPRRAPAPKKPPEQAPAPTAPATKPVPEPAPPDTTAKAPPPKKSDEIGMGTKILIGGAVAVGLAALGGGGGGGGGGGSSGSSSLRSP